MRVVPAFPGLKDAGCLTHGTFGLYAPAPVSFSCPVLYPLLCAVTLQIGDVPGSPAWTRSFHSMLFLFLFFLYPICYLLRVI